MSFVYLSLLTDEQLEALKADISRKLRENKAKKSAASPLADQIAEIIRENKTKHAKIVTLIAELLRKQT